MHASFVVRANLVALTRQSANVHVCWQYTNITSAQSASKATLKHQSIVARVASRCHYILLHSSYNNAHNQMLDSMAIKVEKYKYFIMKIYCNQIQNASI